MATATAILLSASLFESLPDLWQLPARPDANAVRVSPGQGIRSWAAARRLAALSLRGWPPAA